jgi:hypothetical protein
MRDKRRKQPTKINADVHISFAVRWLAYAWIMPIMSRVHYRVVLANHTDTWARLFLKHSATIFRRMAVQELVGAHLFTVCFGGVPLELAMRTWCTVCFAG